MRVHIIHGGSLSVYSGFLLPVFLAFLTINKTMTPFIVPNIAPVNPIISMNPASLKK